MTLVENLFSQSSVFHSQKFRDANSNDWLSLEAMRGKKGLLLVFLSNECPMVKHAFAEILRIVGDYRVIGVNIVGVNARGETLEAMTDFGFRNNMDFPYLYDPDLAIAAELFPAQCPDFFVFDADGEPFYHGRLDDSLPGNGNPSGGYDLRLALDMLLADRKFPQKAKPALGCHLNPTKKPITP